MFFKRNWLRDKNNKTILPKKKISQNIGHRLFTIAAKDKTLTKKKYKKKKTKKENQKKKKPLTMPIPW